MATDNTDLSQGANSAGTDESNFDAVQLAQASSAGEPVQVQVPQGQNVVRVPVTAGEVIVLPFGAEATLAGKLGDNGNLAIKVGDVTVILEGYTAAEGQAPVVIETADGKPIVLADVLSAGDGLDIQTAAGDAVGAQGADNTGAIFETFGAGGGIGGFNAIGAQDGTALDYGLIDATRKIFVADERPADTSPRFITGEPNGNIADIFFNEDDLKHDRPNQDYASVSAVNGPDYDGNDQFDGRDNDDILDNNIPDNHREPVSTILVINIDFKNLSPGTLHLTDTGLHNLHLMSNGEELDYVVSADGLTLTAIRPGDQAVIFEARVLEASSDGVFHVEIKLVNRLDHPLTDNPDTLPVEQSYEDYLVAKIHVVVTNSAGQAKGGDIAITFEDDVPVIGADHEHRPVEHTPAPESLSLNLVSPTGLDLPGGITPVGGVVLDIIGINGERIVTQLPASALFKGFFDIGTPAEFRGDPGTIGIQGGFTADLLEKLGGGIAELAVRLTVFDGDNGPGDFDQFDNILLLNGKPFGNFSNVATIDTDDAGNPGPLGPSSGGFRDGALDTGWFHVVGDSPSNIDLLNDIYNSLVPTGELTLQLKDFDTYPLNDPQFPGLPDNDYDFTRGVEGSLPPQVITNTLPAADESELGECGEHVSGSFQFNYGADGPWEGHPPVDGGEDAPLLPDSPLVLALKIIDPDAVGGVYFDSTSIVPPDHVLKSHGEDVHIVQSWDPSSVIYTGYAGGIQDEAHKVFEIAVDKLTGEWTGTFFKPLDHPDAGNDNDNQTGNNDVFQFILTATIKDDDGDQATGTQSFVYRDDGPHAVVLTGTTVTIDESAEDQEDDQPDANVPAAFSGLGSIIEWAQSNGPVVDVGPSIFGKDGPGSITVSLSLSSGAGVDSGLTTLDGAAILLFQEGDLVVGRVGSSGGAVAVAFSIDSDGVLSVAQYLPIHHPDATDPNDTLPLAEGALLVSVTVTDYDGDVASSSVDISASVNFRDDAPIELKIIYFNEYESEQGAFYNNGKAFAQVDEDWLSGGNHDADGANVDGDESGTAHAIGSVSVNFGVDLPGHYELDVADGKLADVKTSDGKDIYLATETVGAEDHVIGYVDNDNDGKRSAGDTDVFLLSLQREGGEAGDFDFRLYKGLDQNAPDGKESSIPLQFGVKAVDKDGDSVSSAINISVNDDRPRVPEQHNDTPQTEDGYALVDEDELSPNGNKDSATGDDAGNTKASGTLNINYGGDGKGSVGFSGIAAGDTIPGVLALGGGAVIAHIETIAGHEILTGRTDDGKGGTTDLFVLDLDLTSGKWNFELKEPLQHDLQNGPTEDNIKLAIGVTVTDADGDSASGAIKISIDDDMPVIHGVHYGNLDTAGYGMVDEDDLPSGNHDSPSGIGDDFGSTDAGLPVQHGNVDFSIGADQGKASLWSISIGDDASNNVYSSEKVPGGTVFSGFGLHTASGDLVNVEIHDGKIFGYVQKDGIDGFDENAGDVKVFELTFNQANGDFDFTLYQALQHPFHDPDYKNDGEETLFEDNLYFTFGVQVVDNDNDRQTAQIKIRIDDDTPVAVDDGPTNVAELGTVSGLNAAANDMFGADGKDLGGGVTLGKGALDVGNAAVTAGGTVLHGNFGDLTIKSDGSYSYTSTKLVTKDEQDVFSYTIKDGDGDASSASITINIKNNAEVPTIHVPSITDPSTIVYEKGLPTRGESPGTGEAADGDGTNDDDTSEKTSGTFTVTSVDALSFVKVDGTDITGAVSGSPATHVTVDTPLGLLTITNWDAATKTASYTYLLQDNADHSGGPITETFALTTEDVTGDPASNTLTITVVDDAPQAKDNTVVVQAGTSGTADVVFIVDVSGSMTSGSVAGVPGGFANNRLGLARYSMQELLNSHPEIKNVQFIKFDDGASHSVWLTRDQALLYIANNSNFNGGGTTNYDVALAEMMSNYGNPADRPAGQADQTLVYFLSDGEPNTPNGDSAGITNKSSGSNVSIGQWETFVTNAANDITQVFAIGIGNGVNSANVSNLEPIAYPNMDSNPADGTEDNVVIISSSDLTHLTQTMDDLLGSVLTPVSGDVTLDSPADVPGADGWGASKLVSITYDTDGSGSGVATTTKTFSAVDTQFTIDMGADRGTLLIHDDGTYTYTPPSGAVVDGTPFYVEYTIHDGDGNTSTAKLIFDINTLPIVDLNNVIAGNDVTVNFIEQTPIQIAPNATITDDDGNLVSMKVTLTNRPDGNAVESLSLNGAATSAASGAGLTVLYTAATGVLSITGSASTATYQTVLKGILYNDTSNAPNVATRSVSVVVNDGVGNSILHTSSINVTPVNDAPSGANNTVTATEDTAFTFSASHFGFSDPIDGGANAFNGIIVTTLPTAGALLLNGNPVAAGATITAGQISGNQLTFVPAANANGNGYANFTFQVKDNGGTANGGVDTDPTPNTLFINVNPVNDAPVLNAAATPVGVAVLEDAAAPSGPVGTLISTLVDFPGGGGKDNVTDVDAGAQTGIAVIGAVTTNGAWFYSINNGASWSALGSVNDNSARLLAADANTRIYFRPNANYDGDATLTFRAWDQTSGTNGGTADPTPAGGSTAFSLTSDTAVFDVIPVNDAPVLNAAASPSLGSVNEDAGAPVGAVGTSVTALADFTGGGGTNNVTDVDSGAVTGIAVTGANTTNGTWWYSINNGGSWSVLGAVSNANALLLTAASTTRIYFQPNANYNGSGVDTITFRAWDQTVGSNGGTADTTTNGGTTAFSSATDTAAITVNAVNDAPVAAKDFIYTTQTGSFTVLDSWLTANDSDVENSPLKIIGVAQSGNFFENSTPSHAGTTVTLDLDTVNSGGSDNFFADNSTHGFTYTVSDGSLSGAGSVDVTFTTNTTIDRSSDTHNDIIIGSAAAETLIGGSGDDVIIGGGGDDKLNGGLGIDWLDGGAGNDLLVYGAGDTLIGGSDGLSTADDGNDGGLLQSTGRGDVMVINDMLVNLTGNGDDGLYSGIETISLKEAGSPSGQKLVLNADDVIDMSDHTVDPAVSGYGSADAIRVELGASDTLYLSNTNDGGKWFDSGQTYGAYRLYVHSTDTDNDPTDNENAYVLVSKVDLTASVVLNSDPV